MKPFATELELTELMMRTYADVDPPSVADTIYCYGQMPDNITSVTEKAFSLWSTNRAKIISIPDQRTLPKYGWFYDLAEKSLLNLYSQSQNCKDFIVPIVHPSEFQIAHTHTEAIGLIRHAKEKRWKTIYITALPSHLLRAFCETITAVLKEYPKLHVYASAGKVLPWTKNAEHSQGTISGLRFEVIESELQKIQQYCAKGSLATAKQILNYLNIRDK